MSFCEDVNTMVNMLPVLLPDTWEQQCDNIGNAIGILSIIKAFPKYVVPHSIQKSCMYITTIPTISITNHEELQHYFETAVEWLKTLDTNENKEAFEKYNSETNELYEYMIRNLSKLYNRHFGHDVT